MCTSENQSELIKIEIKSIKLIPSVTLAAHAERSQKFNRTLKKLGNGDVGERGTWVRACECMRWTVLNQRQENHRFRSFYSFLSFP